MFTTSSAAMIRAASYPTGLQPPPWPDLTATEPVPITAWRDWLRAVWTLDGFADAVRGAAPSFAEQVRRALDDDTLTTAKLQRVIDATARYLLRWTSRATPFGTFAGVAPVTFGPRADVRWGDAHRDVTAPDGALVAEYALRAEQDLDVVRRAAVTTNPLGYRRGASWVLPCGRVEDHRISDVEIRLSEPIRFAVDHAVTPISFSDLEQRMIDKLGADGADAAQLLAALVAAGVLLSQIRPPTVGADPVTHLARYGDAPAADGRVVIDRRLDCALTLPPAVTRAACDAADALVTVAPWLPGWRAYHAAFIERWGPGAAVPLHDVLRALGYPTGYRGAPQLPRAAFTARDRLLGQLAQNAALHGCTQIELDDALLSRLHGDDTRPAVPHTELRFTLAADSTRALERGDFTLSVVGGSRHAGAVAGRFLPLLTADELARFRAVYTTLPTAIPGADLVQISAPPLTPSLAGLARSPAVLPVLPVGDVHPDPPLTLVELAVAGDGHRLWLHSLSTGRPVEALLLNALRLPTHQQPLVRFLTEIWLAFNAPCSTFDWGHASGLAFLPRVRRGRSILHPARWVVTADELPARAASLGQWRTAWHRHRTQIRLPDAVLLGDGDVQLQLDLDNDAHLAMLRRQLDQRHRAVLTEAPGPAGWLDDRPAEVMLTLTQKPPAAAGESTTGERTRPAYPAATVQHRPGDGEWLDARLYGSVRHILTDLAQRAGLLPDGWWFLRYPDPRPHVRLRVPLCAASFGDVARQLACWAAELDTAGVLADYALATYRPETRHGTGRTRDAAVAVFAADSLAVLDRLTRARADDLPAVTAAAMIGIAEAFTGAGLHWIAEHVAHRGGDRLNPAQLDRVREHLAAAQHPAPPDNQLSVALHAYRELVDADGLNPDQALADLLHLHHARQIGVDLDSERHCLRLARAIAHSIVRRGTA